MHTKFLLGFICLMLFVCWGCSSLHKADRSPMGTMDAEVIGPKGEVILFYKENVLLIGNVIVVKQCEDHVDLELRGDCKVKPGTVVQNVPVSDFRKALKMALRLPGGNYDDVTKEKIELYNKRNRGNIEGLLKRQRDLKVEINKIESFIEKFGKENTDSNYLSKLKESLSQVDGELGDHAQLDRIIKEINGEINSLVDHIISSDALHEYVFSKQKTGFIFNILRAYLRAPMLSASFQRIEKDSFDMGSPSNEADRDGDEDQKRVTISKSFDIMITEVTQMQWFLVMGDNPSRFKSPENCDNHVTINGQGLCPRNPVERVSWNRVQEYIKKLNDSHGLSGCEGTPKDSEGCYRLPTEAEWELAARGNTTTAYSFGDESSRLGDYAWYWENSGSKTHPVGLKEANPYGLYDVHGNVWEWVQDKYNKSLPGGIDPLHTSSGSYRVFRGGSWNFSALVLRSANRSYGNPGEGYSFVGFRLVRTL